VSAVRAILLGTGGSAGVPHIGGPDGHGDWGACDPGERRNRRTRSSVVLQARGSSVLQAHHAGALQARDAGGPPARNDGGHTAGTLLVDTSPDMRAQLLDCGIAQVDALLFTHAHADHILGLDDVRLLNRIAGRPLEAFGTEATLREIADRFSYAFRPWQPPGFYRPVLVPHAIVPGETIEVGDLRAVTFEQDHGFSRSLGLRAGPLAYSTDAVSLDEAAFAILEGVDTWVVGCFQRGEHRTHACLDRVLEWLVRVRPRRAVLTHMGYDMDWAWLSARLPDWVEPGYDGMVIDAPG
jgi:phosphoribosyl 1,2-cyclic phosphate phosphodiesterase